MVRSPIDPFAAVFSAYLAGAATAILAIAYAKYVERRAQAASKNS